MDLINWFFADAYEDPVLREVLSKVRLAEARSRIRAARASAEDLGLLALVLLSLIESLISKGLLRREDLLAQLGEIDRRDGRGDSRIDLAKLREALGLPPRAPVRLRKRPLGARRRPG